MWLSVDEISAVPVPYVLGHTDDFITHEQNGNKESKRKVRGLCVEDTRSLK